MKEQKSLHDSAKLPFSDFLNFFFVRSVYLSCNSGVVLSSATFMQLVALAFVLEIENDRRLCFVKGCTAGKKSSDNRISSFKAAKGVAIFQ